MSALAELMSTEVNGLRPAMGYQALVAQFANRVRRWELGPTVAEALRRRVDNDALGRLGTGPSRNQIATWSAGLDLCQ